MSFCNDVKSDKYAFAICGYMAENFGLNKADFDTGVPHVVHSKDGQSAKLAYEKPNDKLEPAEVYKKAIELAEKEEDANRASLLASGISVDEFVFESPFNDFLKTKGDMDIAWLFDDGNPAVHKDKKVFAKVNKEIKRLDSLIVDALGVTKTSTTYQKLMALLLFNFIKKPRSEKGLGIVFDDEQKDPEKNVVQTVEAGKATCTEFTKLYTAMARLAGLDVFPVKLYKNSDGDTVDHLRAGVKLPNAETIYLDLEMGVGCKKGEKLSAISKSDLLGDDYDNRYLLNKVQLQQRTKKGFKNFLVRSLDFSPNNYKTLFDYGNYLSEVKKAKPLALKAYLKSYGQNPFYTDTHHNLCYIYSSLEMYSEFLSNCEKYYTLSSIANTPD